MTRYRASGIHLLISFSIALVFLALVFFVWYPQPYFEAGGGKKLLAVLIIIDITLGPLITLIIYKEGKKGLKFDLSVIVILQTAALIYGGNIILNARPVYVVYVIDRFVLVSANDISEKAINEAKNSPYNSISLTGPELVAAVLPKDQKALNKLMFDTLSGQPDIDVQPKYYTDFDTQADTVRKKSLPLKRLDNGYGIPDNILNYIKDNKLDKDKVTWFPLTARTGFMVMLIDNETARPLKAFNHDPWGTPK